MAQISRPFQIVLAVFVLFAVAWFALLHRPGGESSTGRSAPSVAAPSSGPAAHARPATPSGATTPAIHHARVAQAAHPAKAAAGAHATRATPAKVEHHKTVVHSTHRTVVHHTAVVNHTHKAVAHSAHGQQPRRAAHDAGSGQAGSSHTGSGHTGSSHTGSGHTGSGHAGSGASHETAGATAALALHTFTQALHQNALLDRLNPTLRSKITHADAVFVARMKADLQPASQATVAAELHGGKTVLLLFLNPHSYDDDATAIETMEVAHKLAPKLAAHFALANQVNAFGSITRDIQVYQTPTLLIVTPKRQVTTLGGLLDRYAIEQAISEARG